MNGFSNHDRKQIVGGAILAYAALILNALYGFFLAPFVLRHVGSSDYGVYQTIASLSQSLMIIDIGLGSTVVKYIAEYNAKGEQNRISSLLKIIYLAAAILITILVIVTLGFRFNLNFLYGKSFSDGELSYAKRLLGLFILFMVLSVISNITGGILGGMNRIVLKRGLGLLKIVIKYVSILIFVPIVKSSYVLLWINIIITSGFLVYEIACCISIIPKSKSKVPLDKDLLKPVFLYTALIFAQSVINQCNSNLDNVIVGSILGSLSVTVYSFGLTLYAAYEHISTAISSVMLPAVTNCIYREKAAVDPIIIKAGRVQFLLMGALLFGFIILGKDFIALWLGKDYDDVYIITLVLIGPATFELTVNVCLTVLRAKNKLGFRTIVLGAATLINCVVSIIGTKRFGYFAAAIGTAISNVINIIVMGIYYKRVIGINIVNVYRSILSKTVICLLIAAAVTALLHSIAGVTWVWLFGEIAVFVIVYAICLFLFGLNDDERRMLKLKRVS